MVQPSKLKPTSRGLAVVTGAAGILGPGLCATLKAEGWTVAACDLSGDEFVNAENYGFPVPCDGEFYADLTSPAACQSLIAEIEATLGPPKLLVNNAVNEAFVASLPEMTPEIFSASTQLNLGAPIFLTQAALPSLSQQMGSVVMISSVRVQRFAPRRMLYSVTKAAVEKLTEALAYELTDKGVRVNCVRVGSVPGLAFMRPILRKLEPAMARELCDHVLPAHLNGENRDGSVRSHGKPSDIGSAICYLASDEAAFINGVILPVDGGFAVRGPGSSGGPSILNQSLDRMRTWLAARGLEELMNERSE